MRRRGVARATALGLALLVPVAAPGEPKKRGGAKPASADAGMPKLRTGAISVEEGSALVLQVSAASIDGSEQVLELASAGADPAPLSTSRGVINARSVGGGPAFASVDGSGVLRLRRPAADAARALEGELYTEPSDDRKVMHHRFSVPPPAASKRDDEVRERFGSELAQTFESRQRSSPFYTFARERVLTRYTSAKSKAEPSGARRTRLERGELRSLMDTTTGMTSVQEAIQADRPLFLALAKEPSSVPFASLKPPQLAHHPFDKMRARLTAPARSDEPLAEAAPAEFYYLRVHDLSILFRIVDQLDAWATPAINTLDGHHEDRGLAERTLAQLGLDRGPLARALGTSVVGELAVVGSDPYFREGTDVTVLFQVKQRALFDAALVGAAEKIDPASAGSVVKKTSAEGVTITSRVSAAGPMRQHRASAGDLEIVSNSEAALRRVLASIAKKAPRLSDEPDFRYMQARSGGGHPDGLGYLSDRFIAEAVGPRQKIMESRRQLALAELLVPGYAALLHGWLEGRAPESTEALLASGWLKREDLRHADGSEIKFSPRQGASSRWGRPAMLEPLYEQPAPKTVSASERDAYQAFTESYQRYWRAFIDPVQVRFTLERPGTAQSALLADMRVLPLIDGTDYRKIEDMVGRARLTTPELGSGLRAVFGIGQEAHLRRELSSFAEHSPLGGKILFDWLGDWFFVGVQDRAELARTVVAFEPHSLPQPPESYEERNARRRDDWRTALRTPIYVALSVRNSLGAALFMTGLRKFTTDAGKDFIQWGEAKPYRGVSVTRIALRAPEDRGATPTGAVYYAITKDALLLSLDEAALHALLDERAGGKGTATASAEAPQFALQWGSRPGAPLSELLGWFLEKDALRGIDRARHRAEVFLRGAPGQDLRKVALLYEGAEPIPADGGHFTLGPDGVRDEARGSALLMKWPSLPVPGSPVARLLTVLQRFSAEVSFDDEPAVEGAPRMRSLHARARLTVRD